MRRKIYIHTVYKVIIAQSWPLLFSTSFRLSIYCCLFVQAGRQKWVLCSHCAQLLASSCLSFPPLIGFITTHANFYNRRERQRATVLSSSWLLRPLLQALVLLTISFYFSKGSQRHFCLWLYLFVYLNFALFFHCLFKVLAQAQIWNLASVLYNT